MTGNNIMNLESVIQSINDGDRDALQALYIRLYVNRTLRELMREAEGGDTI